jgi:HD domain
MGERADSPRLTGQFSKALVYAELKHHDQVRKGGEIPYFGHLMAVAGLVINDNGSEEQAIAALLHDAVEDAGGPATLAEIKANFGDVVARIVDECSDTDETPKPPWRERKERYIAHLAHVGEDTILVSLADKLDNARSMLRDYHTHGPTIVACMGTAAALYGFDTESTFRLHFLDPGVRMRPSQSTMVHQRIGAPLRRVRGRLATAPAWTAIEVARALRRPRALATLDAALHVGACTRGQLDAAIREQKGRRGIVMVRELVAYADSRAESPMESEARLLFIDSGLPMPELQYSIVDRCRQTLAR